MINIVRSNIRVSQIVSHTYKSQLMVSVNGNQGTYVKWGGSDNVYKCEGDPKSFALTMSKVFTDYERCSRLNNDKYVAIAGYDKNDTLDSFFLLQQPLACDIPETPGSSVNPNDVY